MSGPSGTTSLACCGFACESDTMVRPSRTWSILAWSPVSAGLIQARSFTTFFAATNLGGLALRKPPPKSATGPFVLTYPAFAEPDGHEVE